MTDSELYTVEDGWIELRSGTKFHFGAPEPATILAEDVAHALSRLCRYNGHTKRFYSVAEHCVVMADYVARQGGSARECLTALHHDDAEYIIGDLPRPIKVKMPQFKELETILDMAVARRFGTIYPFPGWLKDLDARILVDEREQVMAVSNNEWGTDELVPLGVRLKPFSSRSAWLMRRAFLKRHRRWRASQRRST